MSRQRAFVPSVSGVLEPRLALSQTAGVLVVAQTHELALAGTIRGTDRFQLMGVDTSHHALRGTGRISPLGRVGARGSLNFADAGILGTGTLTLSTPKGVVHIHLQVAHGTPGGSNSLEYTITGGTVTYRHASGSGTATFVIGQPTTAGAINLNQPTRAPFTLTFLRKTV